MNKKSAIGLFCILISFIIYMAFFINSLQRKNENIIKDNEELVKKIEYLDSILNENNLIISEIKNSNNIILKSSFNNAWLEGCIACMKNIKNNGKINKFQLDSVKTLDSLVFINTIKN